MKPIHLYRKGCNFLEIVSFFRVFKQTEFSVVINPNRLYKVLSQLPAQNLVYKQSRTIVVKLNVKMLCMKTMSDRQITNKICYYNRYFVLLIYYILTCVIKRKT